MLMTDALYAKIITTLKKENASKIHAKVLLAAFSALIPPNAISVIPKMALRNPMLTDNANAIQTNGSAKTENNALIVKQSSITVRPANLKMVNEQLSVIPVTKHTFGMENYALHVLSTASNAQVKQTAVNAPILFI